MLSKNNDNFQHNSPIIAGSNIQHMEKREKPHMAIITFKIDVRAMNSDDTLELHVMNDAALKKYDIAQKGQMIVKGYSEADCINNIKEILRKVKENV
tara:strand:+ start:10 stop:300 length:291 start_codon:yes stop_codon:yes gene_type:complete